MTLADFTKSGRFGRLDSEIKLMQERPDGNETSRIA
jgi:hypothetical protein